MLTTTLPLQQNVVTSETSSWAADWQSCSMSKITKDNPREQLARLT